jgi:hypothetical protein
MSLRRELPAQEGFALCYNREEGARFHGLAAIAAMTSAAYVNDGYQLLLAAALFSGCAAYYYFPFTEQRRARLGGNQYGLFIDGLGLIDWKAIDSVKLGATAMRSGAPEELLIKLNAPLGSTLLVDWRRLAIWRLLMRLPWSMGRDNIVRVTLQPFAPEPQEIYADILRLWRYYR